MTDRLDIMLKMQKSLQENAYGYKFDDLKPEARVAMIKEMSIHATQEIHEMLYELPYFKPWKDYSKITDNEIGMSFEKSRKEFIDFIHFTLNMALLLDLTAEDIAEDYIEKNQENYKRQQEGYTHDKTYRT